MLLFLCFDSIQHGPCGVGGMQAAQVVEGLGVTTDKKAAMDQIKALYTVFDKSDCTMVEVRRALPHAWPAAPSTAIRLLGGCGLLVPRWCIAMLQTSVFENGCIVSVGVAHIC